MPVAREVRVLNGTWDFAFFGDVPLSAELLAGILAGGVRSRVSTAHAQPCTAG